VSGREISIVLIVLVLSSPFVVISEGFHQRINHATESGTRSSLFSDVVYNSSVTISSDADFVLQNWPGNGTMNQPYLISNLRFSHSEDWPIRIYNTQSYFLIVNCTVEPSEYYPAHSDGKGILLYNITNCIVENCSINDKNVGVYVDNSNNTIVRNNLIITCDTGIFLSRLERCILSNNSIRKGNTGIQTLHLRFSNLTGNQIVESHTGIGLSVDSKNNTLSMNRIGWCIETNAKDYGSNNTWDGNSWSDWEGIGPYLISGSAGSVDDQPTLFDEDVIAPMFEFYHYHGSVADLLEPFYSFTFVVNVSDATCVDTVSLYLSGGYTIVDGIYVATWIEYSMNHQPIEGNPNRYFYTFDCNGSFGGTYHFWANDTLGFSRRSEIDSFSLGYFPWEPLPTENPPPLSSGYLLLLPLGVLVIVWLIRRLRPTKK